jgi:hypothetical protein
VGHEKLFLALRPAELQESHHLGLATIIYHILHICTVSMATHSYMSLKYCEKICLSEFPGELQALYITSKTSEMRRTSYFAGIKPAQRFSIKIINNSSIGINFNINYRELVFPFYSYLATWGIIKSATYLYSICNETTLTGKSQFHISTSLGI